MSKGYMPKRKEKREYNGGPIKYDEAKDKYEAYCTYCDKSIGHFAGADHAREALEEHKETH